MVQRGNGGGLEGCKGPRFADKRWRQDYNDEVIVPIKDLERRCGGGMGLSWLGRV